MDKCKEIGIDKVNYANNRRKSVKLRDDGGLSRLARKGVGEIRLHGRSERGAFVAYRVEKWSGNIT
jgi:hypothetical protein